MNGPALYLMQIGSKREPSAPTELFIQPMTGCEERLDCFGDPFWIREDVFDKIINGTINAPEHGRLPMHIVETGMTCPRRANTPQIPFNEGTDYWYKQGPDRKCSFCGSIHPDDLNYLLDNQAEMILNATNKDYKIIIDRPGIINAGFGAIKWHTWHGDAALLEKVAARMELQFNGVHGYA